VTAQSSIVLIIDNDLAFVFWLGEILARAGYEPYPAQDVPQARQLLSSLPGPPALVIVNTCFPGAAAFLRAVRQSIGGLQAIGISDPASDPSSVPSSRGGEFSESIQTVPRPTCFGGISVSEWLNLIERVLSRRKGAAAG
jgi:DNA-binding NtrC family response regulator